MESEGPKHIPRDNVFCETDCPRCAYDHKEFMKSEEARMESEGPHTHEHSVYTRCLECQSWGINLPGETRCGNCSAEGGVLYVPDCCVRAAYAEGRKSVQIKTPCPSCGFTTLCVDDSGNLVCSFLECKNPTEIANKEGRKAAEKDFKELLELANEAGYFNQDIMSWRMKYADWKRARGIE